MPFAQKMATQVVEVPAAFNAFEVFPRDEEEERDERMPKTIGHAYLVFVQTGEKESAERCRSCMESFLHILTAGPTGSLVVNVGQACLCWECGHVGIPVNAEELDNESTVQVKRRMPPFAICKQCRSGERTNFIIGRQEGAADSFIPFIELSTPPPS